jgi:predicted transposase/invertase (TIGR01784 family)
MIDHDRLFKELLSNFFPDFIALFFPDITAYLEPNSLAFLPQEVFTDVTSGERKIADLVVQAEFTNQPSLFIIHLEHQSSSEADFNKRMFRYFARLHEKYDLPVYPIVLFSFDTPHRPEPDSYQVQFPGWTVLEFNYRVIQLNRLQWQDFVNQQNPVASALMSKMRIDAQERPTVKLVSLQLLASLGLNPAQVQLISGFIDTYLKLNAEEEEMFQAELARIEPVQQEEIMEIVTSWMEQGIQRGLQQGLQQGRQQGELALVMRLLTRRLGAVAPQLRERIGMLSIEQLEDLGEALLDFTNTADLEAWLGRQ